MQTLVCRPDVSDQGFKPRVRQPRLKHSLPEFWDNVDKSGGPDACWPFIGPLRIGSYGQFKGKPAHREAYRRAYGEPRHHVLHRCDNPPCCNPRHLYDGTPLENARDREERSRGNHAFGERGGRAKLTDANVREARELRAEGLTFAALATRYGVDKRAIERAVKGETWSHISAAEPDHEPTVCDCGHHIALMHWLWGCDGLTENGEPCSCRGRGYVEGKGIYSTAHVEAVLSRWASEGVTCEASR